MASTTSRNSKYITLHPFDSVYTIVFIFLMFDILANTVVSIFNHSSSVEVSSYNIIISLFLFFQLSRMYYHLKNFENIIAIEGNNHFLEILPEITQTWEKVVRIFLAAILVLFSKFQELFDISPPFTLIICFLALIVWDLIVINGLKTVIPNYREFDDQNNIKIKSNPSLENGKSFFYWRENDLKNELSYFTNFKFLERLSGLIASLIALYCSMNSESQNGLPIILLTTFGFFIALFTILGKWKTNDLTPDNILIEMGKNIFRPFYMPVLSLVNNLKNNKMDNNNKKKWLTFIIAALISILIFLIWKNSDNSKTVEKKLTTIKIATSKNLWCAMTLIALDRHYFEQVGLNPEVNFQAAGRLNMDALLGGSVDIANVVETNIAYQALNNVEDLKIHGRIVSANDYTILTTQKSKVLNPQDLQNKSISYSQATGAESFLFWFMEHYGLLNKNLKLIPLQPAGLVDNFIGGGSDAVTAWEPFVSTIQNQKKDLGSLFRADSLGFKGIMTVATKENWASNNKSTMEAYQKAMEKASKFIKDSTSTAQMILSKETGIPAETIVNSWSRFNYDYTTNLESEKLLIADVIRRIKIMVSEKKDIKEQDIQSYFN